MRIPPYITASTLLGLCVARSVHQHGHEQFHNERREALLARNKLESSPTANVTCGCTTVWTTWYGEPTLIQPAQQNSTTSQTVVATQTSTLAASSKPEAPTTTSLPPPVHEAPTTTSLPAPVHEATTHAQQPAQSAKEAAPKPASPVQKPSAIAAAPEKPASKPQSSKQTSPITTSGSQWSMTYSPYTSSGGCKPSSDIASDVALIAQKGFSAIRLYSTDCNGLNAVATAALSHNINLILGVYISASGISVARPQIQEIVTWATANGHWKGVEMIVVGNEAVFNHYCSASDLASFVSEAKSAFSAAGYSGPVTTTETIEVLTENKETLCPVSDIAAANIHPFFNGKVTASQAGEFVASQLTLLESVCPGKQAYNLETGWPSKGQANGAAVPGTWEQSVAVEGIKSAAGGKSAFFSFVDDLWKEEGEWGVERSWGCSHLF
ncbi:MAG: hypothetical protein Q9218_005636 [Villophora microphyllina]